MTFDETMYRVGTLFQYAISSNPKIYEREKRINIGISITYIVLVLMFILCIMWIICIILERKQENE